MTIRQLRNYCLLPQFRFGLAHWRIELRWMTKQEIRENESKNKVCHGFTHWDEQNTWAEIAVRKGTPDQKRVIIHELLHIRIEGHRPCTSSTSIPMEVAINALTEAYLG